MINESILNILGNNVMEVGNVGSGIQGTRDET